MAVRNLVVVLGDQLSLSSAAFDQFDKSRDLVWMAEVSEESTKVWSHKVRITMFLSAMRHFSMELRGLGFKVDYHQLATGSLSARLADSVRTLTPARILVVEPGEWSVRESLRAAVRQLEFLPDRHFFCTREEFVHWASTRKQLRMEFFYRMMRERHGYLMEKKDPIGGDWNFDKQNRKSFGKSGPPTIYRPSAFPPDEITCEVIKVVEEQFPEHPGNLKNFDYPVTPADARAALQQFITLALPNFGDYQDAMWTGEHVLFHSRLSAAMNLKILDPREVLGAAEQAYHDGLAPLPAVEGFVRQILGWREYVRGIYWMHMPGYGSLNYLNAKAPLPNFYWTGKTNMRCLHAAIEQTLQTGYAHHIQRLMVTGLFALLLGVKLQELHEWYLAIYVDAVEWVELPNTLGMSQYGDGGLMASKPYVASGKYIDRMSNYCQGCSFDPNESIGIKACPFTTLYWDFLDRHSKLLYKNPRMRMQYKNLDRIPPQRLKLIQVRAEEIRKVLP